MYEKKGKITTTMTVHNSRLFRRPSLRHEQPQGRRHRLRGCHQGHLYASHDCFMRFFGPQMLDVNLGPIISSAIV